jgi:hypothetical protein
VAGFVVVIAGPEPDVRCAGRPVDNASVAAGAVIFDFDGLLMDTESTGLASWQ